MEDLDLATRTINALHNNDVKKIKDIVKMTEQELADLQGLGGKALAEISKALKKFDLTLSGGMGGKKE
ncbi:MAG: DNA-directed RNA polymerase subunit alpha C-terminal domain-containing protein [Candidatus Andersenbacteria bacterium]